MAIGIFPLRTLVSAIGLAVAILTAVIVPLGYFTVGYSKAANVLELKAELNAGYVAKYIYSNNALWQFHHVRLAEILGEAGAATIAPASAFSIQPVSSCLLATRQSVRRS